MNDQIGNRMKSQYEDRTRYCLPRRTYTVIRVDGKAFHTFTRGSVKPFDYSLMAALDAAAIALQHICGACGLSLETETITPRGTFLALGMSVAGLAPSESMSDFLQKRTYKSH